MFEIKKGVPVPLRGRLKYPFSDMKVGDSFETGSDDVIPKTKGHGASSRAYQAAYHFAKRHHPDWKFTARRSGEGFRIWRVE